MDRLKKAPHQVQVRKSTRRLEIGVENRMKIKLIGPKDHGDQDVGRI
jgi:hypothetical protein